MITSTTFNRKNVPFSLATDKPLQSIMNYVARFHTFVCANLLFFFLTKLSLLHFMNTLLNWTQFLNVQPNFSKLQIKYFFISLLFWIYLNVIWKDQQQKEKIYILDRVVLFFRTDLWATHVGEPCSMECPRTGWGKAPAKPQDPDIENE